MEMDVDMVDTATSIDGLLICARMDPAGPDGAYMVRRLPSSRSRRSLRGLVITGVEPVTPGQMASANFQRVRFYRPTYLWDGSGPLGTARDLCR